LLSLLSVCKDENLWRSLFHQTWARYNGRFHREVPVPLDGVGWKKTFAEYFGGSFETWWKGAKETTAFSADDFATSPTLARKKKKTKRTNKTQSKEKKPKSSSLSSKLAFWKRKKHAKIDNNGKQEFKIVGRCVTRILFNPTLSDDVWRWWDRCEIRNDNSVFESPVCYPLRSNYW